MKLPMREQQAQHIYRNFAMDSTRWEKFTPRNGDIIVCTSTKCGTTWAQMICALLIFQKKDFERQLSDIAPWLDILLIPIDHVIAELESQTHRRIIKTHTPFDGLPYYKNVTYLCVGRDPRDVFMSLDNHDRNVNPEIMAHMIKSATAAGLKAPQPPIQDLRERFRAWITATCTPETFDNPNTMPVLPYLKSFWDYRHLSNIHFIHYGDLKRDLGGEMRRIAKILDIAVAESLWPTLIAAAQFESMKKNSSTLTPHANTGLWIDNSRFFHKGELGQWHNTLGPEELAFYTKTMREQRLPELVAWLENGSLG